MKTKLTLIVTVFAVALFGMGCASVKITEEQLQSGLVAHYPFNGNAKDETPNALHGSLGGARPTLDRAGIDAAALKFNGVSDFIKAPHSDLLNIAEGLTISVWLRPDKWTGVHLICAKGSAINNNYDFHLALHSKKVHYAWTSGSHQIWTFTPDISEGANNWMQLVAVHDAEKSLAFFLNGKKMDYAPLDGTRKPSSTIEGPRNQYKQPLWIGVDPRNGSAESGRSRYSGAMDELRIYNRAWSAEEVKALYDLEKPKGK